MQQQNSFFKKVEIKLRQWYQQYVSSKLGYGTPVKKEVWEQQFETGMWEYLGSEEEKGRFLEIANCYREYGNGGRLLDVACGGGWLYGYLREQNLITPDKYLGIDLSAVAVAGAAKRFPDTQFRQMDFNKETTTEKFDVIVFNECIYFFTKPAATVAWCTKHNLTTNGIFVFSIFGEDKNTYLWPEVEKGNNVLLEKKVTNSKGQWWTVKALMPKKR